MQLQVCDIAQYCEGQIRIGNAQAQVIGVTIDSRTTTPQCLYVALPGEKVDGHSFCVGAVQNGAAAVLVSKELPSADQEAIAACNAAIILVEDTAQALTKLASAWRKLLQTRIIALTGSSGKTTTKNLVRDVLAAAGPTVATAGNQNNELGVPLTLLSIQPNCAFAVVEMGMRGEGQLAQLCEFVQPDAALVTNVGTSHMELLGSREAIARAKAEPFTFLSPETGIAFINASDDYVASLVDYGGLSARGVTTVFFDGSGADPTSYQEDFQPTVFASDIAFDEHANPQFTIHIPGSQAHCSLGLAGSHNVHNALAAAAVGAWAGLDAPAIAHALESSVPASGRQAFCRAANGALVIDDSYNANPDSMCASLSVFQSIDVEGRRIAVLGDMYELGSFSEEGHALVGKTAAESGIDRLICVGELARGIADAALAHGMDVVSVACVNDAPAALKLLKRTCNPEDAVLVKASHSVGLEAVVEGLVNE